MPNDDLSDKLDPIYLDVARKIHIKQRWLLREGRCFPPSKKNL